MRSAPHRPAPPPTSARYRQINLVSDQAGKANSDRPRPGQRLGPGRVPGHERLAGLAAVGGRQRLRQGDALRRAPAATSVSKVPLVVNVTGAAPTGQVFNSDASAFVVSDNQGNSGSSLFLFDTENGTIDGWAPNVNPNGSNPSTVTEVARDNGANAVYKGLAIATVKGKSFLYATNFRSGRVEAYDSTFTPVEMPGGLFVDPRSPGRLRAVRHRRDQGQAVRVVRQAGRHAARRRRRARPRVRGRLHQHRQVRPPARDPRRAQLAVGPGPGAAQLRPVRRGPARRQLRQRPHQRLQPDERRSTWASCGSPTACRSTSTGCGA